MTPNDTLRSLRYLMDIHDAKVMDMVHASGGKVTRPEISNFLKKEEEEGFVRCPDEVLAHFLDGLVIMKRGRDDSRPPQPVEVPVSNNTVLKKLRVAFELRDEDLLKILDSVKFPVSKSELGALFRKPGHPNYRPCGDQLLRNFLKGLTLRVRGS